MAALPVAVAPSSAPALAALSLLTLGAGWSTSCRSDRRRDVVEYVPVAAALYGAALYGWGTVARGALDWGPMRGLGSAFAARRHVRLHVREALEELDDGGGLGTVELVALVALGAAALLGAALSRCPRAVGLAGRPGSLAVTVLPVCSCWRRRR